MPDLPPAPAAADSAFLRAARGEPVPHTPECVGTIEIAWTILIVEVDKILRSPVDRKPIGRVPSVGNFDFGFVKGGDETASAVGPDNPKWLTVLLKKGACFLR